MNLLSITFHTTQDNLERFVYFTENEFPEIIRNLMQVEKYFFSEVESDYIDEGKNYNLLLFFENQNLRAEFILSEFENIADIIQTKFADSVMIFQTKLDLLYHRG